VDRREWRDGRRWIRIGGGGPIDLTLHGRQWTRRLRRKQKGTSHRARVSRQTSQPGTPHLGVHPPGVRLHGTRLPGMRPHATRLPSMRHPVTRPRISRHTGTSRTHASQRRNLIPRRTGATNLFPAGGVIPLTQHPLPTWGGISMKPDTPTTHPPEVACVPGGYRVTQVRQVTMVIIPPLGQGPAFQFGANCGSTRAPPLAARAAWREGYSNENIQVAREPDNAMQSREDRRSTGQATNDEQDAAERTGVGYARGSIAPGTPSRPRKTSKRTTNRSYGVDTLSRPGTSGKFPKILAFRLYVSDDETLEPRRSSLRKPYLYQRRNPEQRPE